MTDYPADVLERIESLPCRPCVAWSHERRVSGIEDYLFIGGDGLSARAAAERLGVSERTVTRWRAALRSVTS